MAWRIPAVDMPSSCVKVAGGRPTIVVSQKACQVRSSNVDAHLLERPLIKLANLHGLVVARPRQRVGDRLEREPGVRSALACGLPMVAAKMEQDVVSGDAPQPASERVARAVATKGVQARGRRGEYLLDNVLDIGTAQACPRAP